MNVAIIHYHLKTGGVTSVIKSQIEAVGQDVDVLLLTGQPPETSLDAPVVCIEGLGYDVFCPHQPAAPKVAGAIKDAITSHFGGRCDLVHVHNPTLAKNRQFLQILGMLQSEGMNLLLQIHDFAEDGRPLAYFNEEYPRNCHYAVINTRDRQLLQRAGCVPEGVHLLPNAVKQPAKAVAIDHPGHRILYPIRAIRRKNIGEAILLSLFFETGTQLAITLPPNSPADFDSYNGWKRFAAGHRLHIEFEAGLKADFAALVSGARCLVTTSITEGFGFSFLEPWLHGKSIQGRKLPDICADFEQHGIDLQHLYTELMVPLNWIDADRFYTCWQKTVIDAGRRFDTTVDTRHIEPAFERMTHNRTTIDFGLLGEPFQKQVIEKLLTDTTAADTLKARNGILARIDAPDVSPQRIAGNREAILAAYHPEHYRRRLLQAYAAVARHPVRQRIDKSRLLGYFFNIDHFSLLKWGPYVE